MQINWISYVILMALSFSFCSSNNPEEVSSQDNIRINTLAQTLQYAHFKSPELNDAFSNKVFDLYLKRADYYKRFLLKEDVEMLNKYRNQLDDQFKEGNPEFFNVASKLIDQRTNEAKAYYTEILAKPFNFDADETFETEPKKDVFKNNKEELKDYWRKYLKHQVLIRINDNLDIQEKALAKKDTSTKQKSIEVLEKEARERVLKIHNDWFARLGKIGRNDKLAAYLNAFCNIFDTHTEYFPPKDKDNFDIVMSGQLEGIGATLQEKDGAIKVTSLVVGGPAYKAGDLKANDVIVKVAQDQAEFVDITNMPLDNAIQLIRGKKGTIVRLQIRKLDGSIKTISIKRDVVVIEETFAQSSIINTKDKKKIGFIKLPSFYADFNKKNGRSCFLDMKKEVEKLKADNVDGIIIDLRGNGGGSLEDVVKIGGLFIDKGPIVQVKANDPKPQILEDYVGGTVYDGPLAVMVDIGSASASEIFAAAMQDYKRAIIIGSKSTYGKGTVQRFFNLDDFPTGSTEKLGAVKVTVQKFYRINGTSTQLKGVVPDVVLPDAYAELDLGEKESDGPLPYDEIAKADYKLYNDGKLNVSKIASESAKRTAKDNSFKLLTQQAAYVKKNKDESIVNLNFKKFREMEKREKEEGKKFDDIQKENQSLSIDFTGMDKKEMAGADTSKSTRFKDWFKNIKKDPYIGETINILTNEK